MSSADDSLEARVSALEAVLGLPPVAAGAPPPAAPSSAEAAALSARVASLEKALARAKYRVVHLSRAYDSLLARAEAAEAKLPPAAAQ